MVSIELFIGFAVSLVILLGGIAYVLFYLNKNVHELIKQNEIIADAIKDIGNEYLVFRKNVTDDYNRIDKKMIMLADDLNDYQKNVKDAISSIIETINLPFIRVNAAVDSLNSNIDRLNDIVEQKIISSEDGITIIPKDSGVVEESQDSFEKFTFAKISEYNDRFIKTGDVETTDDGDDFIVEEVNEK